jgi:hypothetical protein
MTLQIRVHHHGALRSFAELGKNLVGVEWDTKFFQGTGDGILRLRVGEENSNEMAMASGVFF